MDFDWKRGGIVLAILIVLVGGLVFAFKPENCESVECFQENMIHCRPAKYVNDEPEASWEYKIISLKDKECEIKVTLLSAKEGPLGLRNYEGNSMNCFYDEGTFAYPEKALDFCKGELKENLQSVIIEKLYKYIIGNLGEIREELRSV